MSAPSEATLPTELPLAEEWNRAAAAALRRLRLLTEADDQKLALRASETVLKYGARFQPAEGRAVPRPPKPPRAEAPARPTPTAVPAPAPPARASDATVSRLAARPRPESPLSAPLRDALHKMSGC